MFKKNPKRLIKLNTPRSIDTKWRWGEKCQSFQTQKSCEVTLTRFTISLQLVLGSAKNQKHLSATVNMFL